MDELENVKTSQTIEELVELEDSIVSLINNPYLDSKPILLQLSKRLVKIDNRIRELKGRKENKIPLFVKEEDIDNHSIIQKLINGEKPPENQGILERIKLRNAKK